MNVEALPISPQELGESPVWHPLEKALYWVDIAQRRLHRWDWEAASHREVPIWDEPGCIAPLRGGGVVVATRTGIIRMDDDLRRSWKITDAPYDTRIQRFNDGKVSPGGDLFLGTVHEPRDHPDACLYHLGPQGLAKVWGQCTVSNGLAWSADGSVMYWSDTWNHVIFRIVIGANQLSGIQPSVWRKFASKEQTSQALPYGGRPDGGAVDSQGCYWSAMFEGRRLLRIPDPAFSSGMSSKQESEYLLPVMCPTMPCFAGPLLDTLVITTARHQRSDDELRATLRLGFSNRGGAYIVVACVTSDALWALSARPIARISRLIPPLKPRLAAFSLPSGVLGPVDCSQGLHCRISSARNALCSGVLT